MVDSGQAFQAAGQGEPVAKETTTTSFAADVITASARLPVLVDFWSAASLPSRQLSAALEKVVQAADGKVKLVRMDIDQHPQIASRLGVRSAPAVFAFQRGQPVDGFMGALPESQIKGFVERLVGPLDDGTEEALAEAEAALAGGDVASAAAIFSAILEQDPEHLAALAGLVRVLVVASDLEGARDVAAQIPTFGDKDAGIIAARAALDLAEQASAVGDDADLRRRVEADPDDHQARFDLALALNAKGLRDEAADALLAIIKRDRTWNDDGARKQLLQFFDAWSLMDPATLSARRKLSTLLFS
ncbi:co-chaperone YbbN [Beijerinckia sp. L45]|uniref:thioredoxin family protein n=1 Tax=Beijerinckia sp. L45 TaxID=1641855 RepID=UPI00131ECD94|nr:co-chaperone YbbN [Beijerinckia sp. L45]